VLDEVRKISDKKFKDIIGYLTSDDLIVLNDTRVIPARLFLEKETGGKVELIIERILNKDKLIAQLRSNRKLKLDTCLFLDNKKIFQIKEKVDDMFLLYYLGEDEIMELFDRSGHIPLPPYIKRVDENIDKERYQTVFSKKLGAVAAPTAGLHFTKEILEKISFEGIDNAKLTLHVGAGTFQPVREIDITQHKMHNEKVSISQKTVDKITATKSRGGRIVAIGTTVVRALESAVINGTLEPYEGETDIFIYPGYEFNIVDGLITNFHLPESTLLMLVCAFGGRNNILEAYSHAIKKEYKFYSYGDAMLIMNKGK
ncbi:MAG: tRNA preQ1(34) S-adenosylmethionine ribosyltransferase-isomerase QueA, partial [Gammaproteobacteria bacterium]